MKESNCGIVWVLRTPKGIFLGSVRIGKEQTKTVKQAERRSVSSSKNKSERNSLSQRCTAHNRIALTK